jgi:hypothetical protein
MQHTAHHGELTVPSAGRPHRQLPSHESDSDKLRTLGPPGSTTYPGRRLSSNAPNSYIERDFEAQNAHSPIEQPQRSPQSPGLKTNPWEGQHAGTEPPPLPSDIRRTSLESGKSESVDSNDESWRMEITRMFDGLDGTIMPSQATIMLPCKVGQADIGNVPPPPPIPIDLTSPASPDESDSEGESGGTLWSTKPMAEQPPPAVRPKSAMRGPPLTVHIDSAGVVNHVSFPTSASTAQSTAPIVAPVPTRAPPPPPPPTPAMGKLKNRARGSTFTDMIDYTWAPRPPPEDVYDRLEDFFPNFDLDQPVIEASSGGTSPTAAEHTPAPLLPANAAEKRSAQDPAANDKSRMRGKKSIRHVAQEHKKRIDRTSRPADSSSSSMTNVMRKRSTKLWGSRVEEVTRERPVVPSYAPESPSSAPKRTSFITHRITAETHTYL